MDEVRAVSFEFGGVTFLSSGCVCDADRKRRFFFLRIFFFCEFFFLRIGVLPGYPGVTRKWGAGVNDVTYVVLTGRPSRCHPWTCEGRGCDWGCVREPVRDIFDRELNESESLTVEGEIESSPDRKTITFYYFCIMSPDAQEMCEILGIVCVPAWSVYFI